MTLSLISRHSLLLLTSADRRSCISTTALVCETRRGVMMQCSPGSSVELGANCSVLSRAATCSGTLCSSSRRPDELLCLQGLRHCGGHTARVCAAAWELCCPDHVAGWLQPGEACPATCFLLCQQWPAPGYPSCHMSCLVSMPGHSHGVTDIYIIRTLYLELMMVRAH